MDATAGSGAGADTACLGLSDLSPEAVEDIRRAIREKYAEVSISAAGKFSYPTGRQGALELGYDPTVIEGLTPASLESFCGVGNPFSLGPIRGGDWVLDYGCGAGLDLITAGRMAGPDGRAVGVDLTEDMVQRAQSNAAAAGLRNVEVRKVLSESLPFDENTFDVVISNGVINLSPCKGTCFNELFRVLKNGGRIQFADVMREAEAPAATGIEAWSQ